MRNLAISILRYFGIACGRHVRHVVVLGEHGSKFYVVSARLCSDDTLVVRVIGNDRTVGRAVYEASDEEDRRFWTSPSPQ